jgi:hypothetical protein
VILALLLSATAAAAAPGAEDLGRQFAEAARRGGAASVTVASIETPRGSPAGLGRVAADAILRGLVASGRVRVVERERLDVVLAEGRLSAAGAAAGAAEPPRLSAGDAVVVGSVARASDGWQLTARVVSTASGEVLGSGRAELSDAGFDGALAAEDESFPALDGLIDAGHALAATTGARDLERLAANRRAPAERRAAAVLALAESEAPEDFALADALRDGEALVRFAAAMALGRGAAGWADGPLRSALREDPSWLARYGAAQALGRSRSGSSERDLAAARLTDPSWRVRRQAADSLVARAESAP